MPESGRLLQAVGLFDHDFVHLLQRVPVGVLRGLLTDTAALRATYHGRSDGLSAITEVEEVLHRQLREYDPDGEVRRWWNLVDLGEIDLNQVVERAIASARAEC